MTFFVITALWITVLPTRLWAHPFGVASVNRYLGLELSASGSMRLAYVLDFAELPSVAELGRLDPDHDGAVTPTERNAYLDALLGPLVNAWTVEVNGVRVTAQLVNRALEVRPGQGGMNTLQILAEISLDHPALETSQSEVTVRIEDNTYSDKPGWREIRAEATAPWQLVRAVPDDRMQTPPAEDRPGRMLRTNEAVFTFRADSPAPTPVETSRIPKAPLAALAWGGAIGLIGLIGFLLRRWTRRMQAIDPRVRVVVTVALTLGAATTDLAATNAAIVQSSVVFVWLTMATPSLRWLAPRMALAAGWAAVITSARWISPNATITDAVGLGFRVALAMMATLPLAASTSLVALADALASLKLPSVFVQTTAATARGVQILRSEAQRLSRARQLRAPDRQIRTRIALYGDLSATLFARGIQRAERSELAWTLRGFDGSSQRVTSYPLSLRDVFVVMFFTIATLASRALP
jgi:energy-coupling factor transporter transmembrane protein EcfT